MPPPNTQPTLPAEGIYTDLEQLFISEQPKNLWPINQNSNLGAVRKVTTDQLQDAITQLNELMIERFIVSSSGYLGRWEAEVGLPVAPTGRTEAQRRSLVLGRIAKGVFTRQRRKEIVEAHVGATFGVPLSLTPDGLTLDAGGLSLFSEGGSVSSLYRIYEDVRNFSYEVRIKDTVDPDFVSLHRELLRITPAHINFTDAEFANILSYFKAVRDKQPVWYGRLAGNANDSSGYGNNGSLNGAPAAIASPGLLVSSTDDTAAYDFDGVDDYISIPDATQLAVGNVFSLEMWVRRDLAGAVGRLWDKGANAFSLYTDNAGQVFFQKRSISNIAASTVNLAVGTTYHVVITKNGDDAKIWINGVDRTGIVTPTTVDDTTSAARVGASLSGTEFFNGGVDEVALYDFQLTQTQVLENYNTGLNIA